MALYICVEDKPHKKRSGVPFEFDKYQLILEEEKIREENEERKQKKSDYRGARRLRGSRFSITPKLGGKTEAITTVVPIHKPTFRSQTPQKARLPPKYHADQPIWTPTGTYQLRDKVWTPSSQPMWSHSDYLQVTLVSPGRKYPVTTVMHPLTSTLKKYDPDHSENLSYNVHGTSAFSARGKMWMPSSKLFGSPSNFLVKPKEILRTRDTLNPFKLKSYEAGHMHAKRSDNTSFAEGSCVPERLKITSQIKEIKCI